MCKQEEQEELYSSSAATSLRVLSSSPHAELVALAVTLPEHCYKTSFLEGKDRTDTILVITKHP